MRSNYSPPPAKLEYAAFRKVAQFRRCQGLMLTFWKLLQSPSYNSAGEPPQGPSGLPGAEVGILWRLGFDAGLGQASVGPSCRRKWRYGGATDTIASERNLCGSRQERDKESSQSKKSVRIQTFLGYS